MSAEEKKIEIDEIIKKAQEYLRNGEHPFGEMIDCASKLYEERKFSHARRLLARLHNVAKVEFDYKLFSKWAISTYKDDDQPGETRYDEAINILTLTSKYGSDPSEIKISRIAGNIGAIYKQKWRFDGQETGLKKALCFLNRGYELWLTEWKKEKPGLTSRKKTTIAPDSNLYDQGYCAINAAYVCDSLANRYGEISKQDPTLKTISNQLRQRATEIRGHLVDFYSCEGVQEHFKERWKIGIEEHGQSWFYTTWVEALMGLGTTECIVAISKIEYAIGEGYFNPNSWSGESAALQIANWIEEDHFEGNEEYREQAKALLKKISGIVTSDSRNDRIGLALSGGGFRASLFHIGVLARLAEENLLRRVEVISCVSGGSIIGAYYYLKVRNLLQTKPDKEITPKDYTKIVKEIETEFLDAINTDLRSNLFGNLDDNIRMAFTPEYSRTSRLADLYENRLYSKLLNKTIEDIEEKARKAAVMAQREVTQGEVQAKNHEQSDKSSKIDPTIYMEDLLIRPVSNQGILMDISPKWDNWKRTNKVPMLVLNATTLNTGHCWQFTASWMGEPPSYINNETDALPTLRRMYYNEAPKPHNKVRLATAVAASSCVPGLFRPIQLRELYKPESKKQADVEQIDEGIRNGHSKKRTDVKQIDKDALDNQSKKLIDVELVDGGVYDNQGINTLIEQECTHLIISDASGQLPSVNDPSPGILSVGGRTNAILQERIRACHLNDLKARLKSKNLKGYLLMHLTKGLPSEVVNWEKCEDPYEPNYNKDSAEDNFGIPQDIQEALARIRTDLDSFHQQEAFTLMYSGYKMTNFEIEKGKGNLKAQNEKRAFNGNNRLREEPWAFEGIHQMIFNDTEKQNLQEKLDAAGNTLKVHIVSPFVEVLGAVILALVLLVVIISLRWMVGCCLEWKVNPIVLAGMYILIAITAIWVAYQKFVMRLWLNPLRTGFGFVIIPIISSLTYPFATFFNYEYLRVGKIKKLVQDNNTNKDVPLMEDKKV